MTDVPVIGDGGVLTDMIGYHLSTYRRSYVEPVDARDLHRVSLVRAAGRKAGKALGVKVRTSQTDPHDGVVQVLVWSMEPLTDAEEALSFEATRQALDAHWL